MPQLDFCIYGCTQMWLFLFLMVEFLLYINFLYFVVIIEDNFLCWVKVNLKILFLIYNVGLCFVCGSWL